MMNNFVEMFSYGFMVRALVVGILISASAALIGVPLVLKRKAMIGDGLSHVGFAAFAIASVFGLLPTEFAIPLVIIVSFFILRLDENSKINGDSAIALISASALALGVMVASIGGVNIDINSYLFGSVLATSEVDVIFSIILCLTVTVIFGLFYHKIFAITFDEKFAKSIGIKTNMYNMLFAILCSVVVVLGMKLVGALLISSLIIFPPITSRYVFGSFKKVTISSVVIGVLSFTTGLILSYVFALPTGATVVIVNLVTLVVFKLISLLML